MHGLGDILFGTSRARWRVGASGPQYVAMKRILSVSIAAVALPLLVACSGGGSPASTTPGSPATAAPATSDAAAPGSTDAPIVAGDDEFCALAVEAQGVADEVTVLTADMNTTIVEALGTGDIATINTWGSELAALSQEMVDFYGNGRPYIEGQEVVAGHEQVPGGQLRQERGSIGAAIQACPQRGGEGSGLAQPVGPHRGRRHHEVRARAAQQHRQALHRLAEPHVVRQASTRVPGREPRQPAITLTLIRAQLCPKRRRR